MAALSTILENFLQFGRQKRWHGFFFLLFLMTGIYLRTSGLFRGLGDANYTYHPDEAKQVLELLNYLHGIYVRYHNDLYYDGYPFGLNHLDEYILRPLLMFFHDGSVDRQLLYPISRALRFAYSIVILLLIYSLCLKMTQRRSLALCCLLFGALAPLAISVAHFATGDIGVDLFTLISLFFLYIYHREKGRFWLLLCGFAIGAAFSAKYNGMLVVIAPGIYLLLCFWREPKKLIIAGVFFVIGCLLGFIVFTPHVLTHTSETFRNMVANFAFIKNYHVPVAIRNLSWAERALLSLHKNGVYIISSLGFVAFFSCFAAVLVLLQRKLVCWRSGESTGHDETNFLLAVTLFPILAFFISLVGKVMVQPFHFSYLQMSLLIGATLFFSFLIDKGKRVLTCMATLLVFCLCMEYFITSSRDNFFWRHEDNILYAKQLTASIFDLKKVTSRKVQPIRSLTLEPRNFAVFRNYEKEANAPDGKLWQQAGIAPVPQVENKIGEDWIFLNGPTFPRNDKMFGVRGKRRGEEEIRYVVLPAGGKIYGIGLQCGSFATEATVVFGKTEQKIALEAHQQKVVPIAPASRWRSGSGDDAVDLIPLHVSVPHNDIWVTVLQTEREGQIFGLFGGEKEMLSKLEVATFPMMSDNVLQSLEKMNYLNLQPHRYVSRGKDVSMWEVALPAGRYVLTTQLEGIDGNAEISIEYRDAKGEGFSKSLQTVAVHEGAQTMSCSFEKTFAPYQLHLVFHGKKGQVRIDSLQITPDYRGLQKDFADWHKQGKIPGWLARFPQSK